MATKNKEVQGFSKLREKNREFKKNKFLEDAYDNYNALLNEKITVHNLKVGRKTYSWSTTPQKIDIIRSGVPYGAIEILSTNTKIPVNNFLRFLELPQTTYNKKKKDGESLSKQDSESIVEITELYDFGVSVFNDEVEKFQRWLRKPNISLGGTTPHSLFDSLTGIQEVKKALNRIEYGNMA